MSGEIGLINVVYGLLIQWRTKKGGGGYDEWLEIGLIGVVYGVLIQWRTVGWWATTGSISIQLLSKSIDVFSEYFEKTINVENHLIFFH